MTAASTRWVIRLADGTIREVIRPGGTPQSCQWPAVHVSDGWVQIWASEHQTIWLAASQVTEVVRLVRPTTTGQPAAGDVLPFATASVEGS